MDVVEQTFLVGLVTWTFVTVVYLFSLPVKNSGLIDLFWGIGFLLVVVMTQLYAGANSAASAAFGLVWISVTLWALRLTFHESQRYRRDKEDYRYRRLRKRYKDRFWWQSYLKIFLPKVGLMWLITLPIIIAPYNVYSSNMHLALAGTIWLVGFVYQAMADWQLAQYKKIPKNKQKIFHGGLWQYSRHPNYFGEIVMWWGIFLAVIGGPYWGLAVLCPLIVTIYYLTDAVAVLEKRWSRSVQYKAYKARTNAVIPWPAKLIYRDNR